MHLFPNFLWKKLIIPLAIMAVFSLILAICIPWRGLFTNLATTFLGILVTICYVDFVLKEHDKKRWAQAIALIEKRIQHFAIVSASQFRSAFNISSGVFNEEVMDIADPSSIRREMIRVIESIILPSVYVNVHNLTREDWIKLVRQLQQTREWADRLCVIYGNHIDPKFLSIIMEIQDEIDSIVILYSIFPDVIGVPDADLPLKKTGSAKADKRGMERVISSNVKNILESAVSLMHKLDE